MKTLLHLRHKIMYKGKTMTNKFFNMCHNVKQLTYLTIGGGGGGFNDQTMHILVYIYMYLLIYVNGSE